MDQEITTIIEEVKKQVEKILAPAANISDEQARGIVKKYVAAIEGNFLHWMAGAAISARSPYGKYAAEENLWVELHDDHPGMLRSFARECKAEPNASDFERVRVSVEDIRHTISELSGLKNLVLMMLLENTSAVFIPYLSELAKKLGAKDLTYTDVHGVADITHADQFSRAVSEEVKLNYSDTTDSISEVTDLALALLHSIFQT